MAIDTSSSQSVRCQRMCKQLASLTCKSAGKPKPYTCVLDTVGTISRQQCVWPLKWLPLAKAIVYSCIFFPIHKSKKFMLSLHSCVLLLCQCTQLVCLIVSDAVYIYINEISSSPSPALLVWTGKRQLLASGHCHTHRHTHIYTKHLLSSTPMNDLSSNWSLQCNVSPLKHTTFKQWGGRKWGWAIDVIHYLLLYMQWVPVWRPWIHVVRSTGPNVHARLDLPHLPPAWPVHHVCCPPVHVVVCFHPVGSIGVPSPVATALLCFTDPGLQGSSCFTNVDLIALCTRDLVHHTLVHVLLWSLHSCE